MKEIIIDEKNANQRFDKFLKKYFKEAGSGFIYKMLRKKNITLNGKKSDGAEIIKADDVVKVFFSDETFEKMRGSDKTLSYYNQLQKLDCPAIDIIHEDSDIIVINKPKGVLSQKSSIDDISINEWALHYVLSENSVTFEDFCLYTPSICNRLDYNTSGIILFAKTLTGAKRLNKALKDKEGIKIYKAVVKGEIKENIMLGGFLRKDNDNNVVKIYDNIPESADKLDYHEIKTEIFVEKSSFDYSVLRIHLITGKTHQIRAHLSNISHPIIGDIKYGDQKTNNLYKNKYNITSQLLHAYSFSLDDMEYIAPLPREFSYFL